MSKEGYLQNKIREQNEEINTLKNRIKKIEIEIKTQSDKFDRSTYLMQQAIDMNNYKKELEKTSKETSKIAFQICIKEGLKDLYDGIYLKHFESIRSVLESHEKALDDNLGFCISIIRYAHIPMEDIEILQKDFKNFLKEEKKKKNKQKKVDNNERRRDFERRM